MAALWREKRCTETWENSGRKYSRKIEFEEEGGSKPHEMGKGEEYRRRERIQQKREGIEVGKGKNKTSYEVEF